MTRAVELIDNRPMDQNPYAPPRAVVADSPAEATEVEPPLFAVSILKLIVLSIVTLGLYEMYWAYKHWVAIRLREQSEIMPAPRAFFGVIFAWALFRRIEKIGVAEGVPDAPPAGFLAIAWVVVTLCWRLPDPVWLISMAAPVFMLPIRPTPTASMRSSRRRTIATRASAGPTSRGSWSAASSWRSPSWAR